MLIRRGEIAEIGPDLRPPGEVEVLDGHGGALIPGLHDHHLHLLAAGAARTSVAVGPAEARDLAGLTGLLQDAGRGAPSGSWLRAIGYHEAVAGDLDRHVLDSIVPDHAVRVQHRTGAQWVLNSEAIRQLGLEHVDEPEVERDSTGRPTGRIHRADAWLRCRLPDHGPPSLADLGRDLARLGITGATDATPVSTIADLTALATAASRELPQHVTAMTGPDLVASEPPAPLRRGPVKLILDEDRLPTLEALRSDIDLAHGHDRPVAVHCVTRASLVFALTAWSIATRRPGDRVEHGSVVPPELRPMIAELGLTIVTQPSFVAERGDQYLADVDEDDLPHLYPCRTLLEAGVELAGSSDAPYTQLDPWAAMRAAVTRRTATGRLLNGAETISPQQALQLYLGPPDRPGGPPRQVARGAAADLCLLDGPMPTTLEHLAADRVVATIIEGARVT